MITTETSQINGVIKCSYRHKGILHKVTYLDYSKTEAEAEFKKYLKTLGVNLKKL